MRGLCALVVGTIGPAGAGAQDTALVEQGVKLYAAQKCSLCHAIDGKGKKSGPLDGVGSKLSAEEIRQWLVDPVAMAKKADSKRKPLMKSYAKLPDGDIAALVAYIQSLKKG
jgi:mono/diheme cytochrome c family protein